MLKLSHCYPCRTTQLSSCRVLHRYPFFGISTRVSGCAHNVPGGHSYPTRSHSHPWLSLLLSHESRWHRGRPRPARGSGHLTAPLPKGSDVTALQPERDPHTARPARGGVCWDYPAPSFRSGCQLSHRQQAKTPRLPQTAAAPLSTAAAGRGQRGGHRRAPALTALPAPRLRGCRPPTRTRPAPLTCQEEEEEEWGTQDPHGGTPLSPAAPPRCLHAGGGRGAADRPVAARRRAEVGRMAVAGGAVGAGPGPLPPAAPGPPPGCPGGAVGGDGGAAPSRCDPSSFPASRRLCPPGPRSDGPGPAGMGGEPRRGVKGFARPPPAAPVRCCSRRGFSWD